MIPTTYTTVALYIYLPTYNTVYSTYTHNYGAIYKSLLHFLHFIHGIMLILRYGERNGSIKAVLVVYNWSGRGKVIGCD